MEDAELGKGLTSFIVGPIGDRLEPPGTPGRLRYEDATQMWENVFEPACRHFGLVPVRADKIAESGEIPEQIFTYLRDADLVIADLTGGNANVMYELGLRHTRDKPTIQIGEHERLPFDVNTIRTVKFKRSEAGLIDARDSLIEAIRVTLEGSGTPVTATRVWKEAAGLDATDVAKASQLSSIDDDAASPAPDSPGQLELMVEGEGAMGTLAEVLQAFAADFQDMTVVTQGRTPEMQAAPTFAKRLTVVKALADDLKDPSASMAEHSSEFLQGVESMDAMMSVIFDQIDKDESFDTQAFATAVIGLGDAAEGAGLSFTQVLPVVRDMRKWSTLLAPVSKSIEHSLNTMLAGNARVIAWAQHMRDVSDGGDGPTPSAIGG